MSYNKKVLDIISRHTKLEFYASALYTFKEGKKTPSYFLADKTPLDTNKKFNVAKAYIQDKVIVFDFDDPGLDLEVYYKMFPSLRNTLTTTSSRIDKHHFYLIYSSDSLVGIRDTTSIPGLDILTTGVIQEAYPASTIVSNSPLAQLTEDEETLLLTLINTKVSRVKKGTFYKNYSSVSHINKLIKDGMPTNRVKIKLVMEALLPTSLYKEKYQSNKSQDIVFPKLNYQLFNDIITKVSYNSVVSVDTRQSLINSLLQYYDIDPNSLESNKRLSQILPSLPSNEGYIEADYDNFTKYIKGAHLPLYASYAIKYIINREVIYTLIDEDTYKPKLVSDDGYQMAKNAVSQFVREQIHKDIADGIATGESKIDKIVSKFINDIPLVSAINHPSLGRITFSDSLMIPQYNMAPISTYYERAVADHINKDTSITRLINSVLGDYQDFYYHLLAHQVFNPSPPQTVIFIVSNETATGKTTLASSLPQALIATARGIEPTDVQAGWGDLLLATKWTGFNDLPKLKHSEWDAIYSFIKSTTTGGQRKLINRKYGGISTATLPSISMGVSSNYYYPIDTMDRRLWVVIPQHLELNEDGTNFKTPKLNDIDADDIYTMFEENPLDYYDEIQDLANYLLHLYQSEPNKYKRELTKRAPMTSYKNNMIDKHSTYTGRILKSIVEGPISFNNILDERYRPFIYKIIVLSYTNGSVALPYKFLADIIYEVQGEPESGVKTKLAQVAAALDKLEDEFKNRTKSHFPYKTGVVKELDSDERARAEKYTFQSLLLPINHSVIYEYKKELRVAVSQKIDNLVLI